MKRTRRIIAVGACGAAVAAATAGIAVATPGSNAGVTLLARGTVGPVHETSPDFKLDQKHAADFVMVAYHVDPGGTLGWHTHPGPALITVSSGTLTIEESDCSLHTYGAGDSFVDVGMGEVHNAFNRGDTQVTGYATYLNVPVGGASRIDADPPACAST
jgi:quercetin dioxygenase-like cupin family protein